MQTVCELCGREIDDADVQCCPACGQDGLCEECLIDHDCPAEIGGPDAR